MKYFDYDQHLVESDPAEFLPELKQNTADSFSYASLNLVGALSSLLDLKLDFWEADEFREFSAAKITKVLNKRRSIINTFLENDQLPNTKHYKEWHWLSYRFRSLLQVVVLYVYGRFGDKNAARQFLQYVKDGPEHQRFAALCMISSLQFSAAGKLPTSWVNAFRTGIQSTTRNGTLFAEVALDYEIHSLESDLLAMATRVSQDESVNIVEHVIQLTRDANLQARLANQTIPTLGLEQLELWFSTFASADEDAGGPQSAIVRTVANRIIAKATPLELAQFLDHYRGRDFSKYATMDHVDALQSVVAISNPANEPNLAHKISKAKAILADLLPGREITLILASGRFESVSEKILDELHASEFPLIIDAAQSALDDGQSFESNSLRLLWQSCGEAGQAFIISHLDSLDLRSIQHLAWLIDSMSLEKLADAMVKTGLTVKSPKSLVSAVKRKYGLTGGPDAFWQIMDVCKRYSAYDMESGEVPPDYQFLIKELCKGTAGCLRASAIRVPTDHEAPVWNISMKCCGERFEYTVVNMGDWYDVGTTEKTLDKVIRKAGFKDRFHFFWRDEGQVATIVFGPGAAIRKIAKLAAVPLGVDHPDDLEELRCKIVDRLRKKLRI